MSAIGGPGVFGMRKASEAGRDTDEKELPAAPLPVKAEIHIARTRRGPGRFALHPEADNTGEQRPRAHGFCVESDTWRSHAPIRRMKPTERR